jgi:hypothetical protein
MDNYDTFSDTFVCINDYFYFYSFKNISRLTMKLPTLLSHLIESKIIKSLLNTLNLSSDMIIHIVKYLIEHPIVVPQSTNFEDID